MHEMAALNGTAKTALGFLDNHLIDHSLETQALSAFREGSLLVIVYREGVLNFIKQTIE